MWIDLEQISDTEFVLPLQTPVCVGPGDRMFMFGGVGLGASLKALETVTGRPTIFATAQYESYARPGETVKFSVSEKVRGNQVSQARVTATVGDREILTVLSALGKRDLPELSQFAQPPYAPPPEDCPPRTLWSRSEVDDIHPRIDVRIAKGGMHGPRANAPHVPDGHIVLWARPNPEYLPHIQASDPAFMAVVADYVPSGVGPSLGRNAGGNSLDNSIRLHRHIDTQWLLCDIQINGVANGFAHGRMHIFAQNGELLATGSQSIILRYWDE